jgi:hypothetical protein
MNFIAIKMLIGDRARFLGIIMGLTFASLLITQQSAIFAGLMARTFGMITDPGRPDIWVVDPKVQFIDDVKAMQDTELLRVRGVGDDLVAYDQEQDRRCAPSDDRDEVGVRRTRHPRELRRHR